MPFISITGSDFMEMFVGVGAARVRDLFQTARKQAPAIIFVDEIDSIGRKRGAGLGGGHDEREQTLNQMLSEMDGFEATEGIVMIAATNRPDILDSALLRPGRFDRQIMVPLPTQDERGRDPEGPLPRQEDLPRRRRRSDRPRNAGHERRRPREPRERSGAVRGAPRRAGGPQGRLRRRPRPRAHGPQRESLALSEEEKEIVAYHEGGHAVCAYVLEFADPLHKVTILPTGMALGVTQQLPLEERHIYKREYIVDSLVVRLGGRVAEQLIFGHQSTGAENDLVGCTELARKMVREWGMSDRVGPMAWGSQGAVFLGEDLMHSRDYSDETARVIDEEVEHILRDEEERCRKVLEEYRAGLDAVASSLLDARRSPAKRLPRSSTPRWARKVGGPRMIIHADGTEEPAAEPIDDPLINPEILEGHEALSSASADQRLRRRERTDERSACHTRGVGEHRDRRGVDLVAAVEVGVRAVLDLGDAHVVGLERLGLVVQARARVAVL